MKSKMVIDKGTERKDLKWEPIPVDNWEKFVKEIEALSPTSPAESSSFYWFRGQSNTKWNLEPSFLRKTHGLDLNTQEAIELESAATQEFKSKAHLFVKPNLLSQVKTTVCWWGLMQHHEAPTRLLDWTTSPYIAAYFACQQDGSTESGAVWGFCSGALQNFLKKRRVKLPDFTRLSDYRLDRRVTTQFDMLQKSLKDTQAKPILLPLTFPMFQSERMATQQGRFTLCLKIRQQHNCIIEQIGKQHIRKIEIPHEKKPEFLARLRDMNITASALFPGVDGLGRSVAELMAMGKKFKTLCKNV